jgi:beta-N-acetylhexosaminidase
MAERGDGDWSDGEDFDWTEPPPRPRRGRPEGERPEAPEPELPDTGEGPAYPGEEEPGTGERERVGTMEHRRSTSEYERVARRPHPTGEHRRHRDLPARVRRRQAVAVGVVAAVVLIGAIVLIGGGDGGEEEEPLALKRVVGQTIVGKVGKAGPDEQLLRRVRKGQLGGVVMLPRNESTLQNDVGRLQDAARSGNNPPLLIMVDQEGGEVKRLPGPPDSSPAELGESGDADASRAEGEQTGTYLAGLGVNVDLAPVLDVARPTTADTLASRTFGDDPARVSELGVAFAEGLQDGGVAATAKHFPGLGLATVNTDFGPVTVAATADDLNAALGPFQAAIDAGVDMVMMSLASYPGLGSRKPAALAPPIVQGVLRDRLGFEGVVITDDLEADAIVQETTPEKAAETALAAGNDLVLFGGSTGTSNDAFNSVVQAAKAGQIERSVLDQAYARVVQLKAGLGSE